MEKKYVYTIWSQDRLQKTLICLDPNEEDQYTTLILKASEKLGLDGSILVLESNGTTVDEDVLVHVRHQILILLEKDQIWTPPGQLPLSTASQSSSSLVVSLPSTNTVLVEGSEEYANQFFNVDIESAGNSEGTPTVGSKVLQELVQNIEISHTVDCNSENFWLQLEVPFNKMNHKEIGEMSNGVRNIRTRKKLVHLVVDEMRNYKETIPTKAFRYIAKKIVDKYPATFKDIDEDGVVLGDGTYSLVMKMQEHHNYLNRPHKRKAPANDNNPVANKKRLLAARSGCVDFAPIPSSSGESVEELKTLALQNDDIEDIVERTFPEVRKFLNRNPFPSVGEIKEEWPIVFSRKGIFLHFNRLTNSRIELLASMREKEEQIRKCSKITSSDGGEIGLMKTIISHFKEKIESVIVEVEDFNDKEYLERSMPSTPCIIKVDHSMSRGSGLQSTSRDSPSALSHQYFVFIDKICIDSEGYENFITAFQVLFAMFFILNIHYPVDAECSMEFIQRYFLKIHPDQGSKTKKVALCRKKVYTLMNRLCLK